MYQTIDSRIRRKQRFYKSLKTDAAKTIYRHSNTIISICIFIVFIIMLVILTRAFIMYRNKDKVTEPVRDKYYTTYTVKQGDTLWDIASDRIADNPEYQDIREYISDVIDINGLSPTGDITAHNTLILPYYQ